MLGPSACGEESTDSREMVAATRSELHARIAEFSRPARPTDRPPVDLIADAERLCRVSALDGPPSRRVARRVGGRHVDVWLVPMTNGSVALVYGTLARSCGSVQSVVHTALQQGVKITTP